MDVQFCDVPLVLHSLHQTLVRFTQTSIERTNESMADDGFSSITTTATIDVLNNSISRLCCCCPAALLAGVVTWSASVAVSDTADVVKSHS